MACGVHSTTRAQRPSRRRVGMWGVGRVQWAFARRGMLGGAVAGREPEATSARRSGPGGGGRLLGTRGQAFLSPGGCAISALALEQRRRRGQPLRAKLGSPSPITSSKTSPGTLLPVSAAAKTLQTESHGMSAVRLGEVRQARATRARDRLPRLRLPSWPAPRPCPGNLMT